METDDMKVKKIVTESHYGFVHDSLRELTKAVEWAKTIGEGGSLADHFYHTEEGSEKIDYGEPNTGLILSVVSYGRELGIPPMRSLAMIIPMGGKFTVRGDQAKAMIFISMLVTDWKEVASGSFDDESFKYTITATRKAPDLLNVEHGKLTLTREFGVVEAKKADLWVTQDKLNGAHGNKHRASTWYRYPARMCMYRALGFIARDLFPEVLGGMIIFEEAGDYPDVAAVFVPTKGGEIPLQHKAGKEQKSEEESKKIKKKIGKRDEELKVEESLQEAREAKEELAELTGVLQLGNWTVKKMDEGEVFETYVKVGDIITTSYKTGPFKVEEINQFNTITDPVSSHDIELPEGWVNFSLILSDPDNPKKTKSYINDLIIKDGKIVSQISDDEIFVNQHVTDKDIDPSAAVEIITETTPSEIYLKSDTIQKDPQAEDTNPWAPIEEIIQAFPKYGDQELLEMGTRIYDLANKMGLYDLIKALPPKKTNKKYRTIILAAQAGKLAEVFQDLRSEDIKKAIKKVSPGKVEEITSHPGGEDTAQVPASDGDVEKEAAIAEQDLNNKFDIEVPEKEEGQMERDFQDARKIAFSMSDNGINNNAWNRIASQLIYNQAKGLTYLSIFKTKENFCKQANTVDIHYFINQHEE